MTSRRTALSVPLVPALSLACALAACGGNSNSTPDAGPDGGPNPPSDAGPGDAGPPTDGGPDDDGGTIAAQMNDLSILYPLATDGGATQVELLAASSSGARGVLLPSNLYDAVGHVIGSTFTQPTNPGGVGVAAYPDLHVVAARIDPCFADTAPDPHGANCQNQLRLIFQEVTLNAGSDAPGDSALHVFYALTRAELEGLVRSVIALRVASAGSADLGPLQPHPLMRSQGLSGAFATGLRALILQHAGASNLIRVTKLDADDNVFSWAFSGFDVSDATAAAVTPMVIPSLAGSATSQSFFRNFGANAQMQGHFVPATTSADDLVPLANTSTASALSSADAQSAFDGLVRVEDPRRNTPNSIDCASCHLATPTSKLNAGPLFGFSEATNADAFTADGRYVPAADFTATFDVNGFFNVHAFSYAPGPSAAINQRTVNETAAIVAYLHTLQ